MRIHRWNKDLDLSLLWIALIDYQNQGMRSLAPLSNNHRKVNRNTLLWKRLQKRQKRQQKLFPTTKVEIICLIHSFDIFVGTHTSEEKVCNWMQYKVRDSCSNADLITSAVFLDKGTFRFWNPRNSGRPYYRNYRRGLTWWWKYTFFWGSLRLCCASDFDVVTDFLAVLKLY